MSIDVRVPEGYGFVVIRISNRSLELFKDLESDKKKFNSMLNFLDPMEKRANQQYSFLSEAIEGYALKTQRRRSIRLYLDHIFDQSSC